ncbi:hypothetical protein AXG93_1962s1190 [Marchantia polymorpha subsp. ruderalis]|uniref:Uncharacterized protein n=1 Tax=Marchantia polymorpha subsp. ruderalis TaxID=1480154 RepID=A0A176WFZ2_MARPO|nr:hypothetical protein AXG93_1962s1190 [Marchantia polymorpha subsp. ruderalis]
MLKEVPSAPLAKAPSLRCLPLKGPSAQAEASAFDSDACGGAFAKDDAPSAEEEKTKKTAEACTFSVSAVVAKAFGTSAFGVTRMESCVGGNRQDLQPPG